MKTIVGSKNLNKILLFSQGDHFCVVIDLENKICLFNKISVRISFLKTKKITLHFI